MKLIDDKDRLWVLGWRINIIDLMALVFLFSMLPILFFIPKVIKNEEYKRIIAQEEIKKQEEIQKAKDRRLSQLDEFLNEHKRARKYFKD